jgi:fatty-acyl-CoA synthase
MLGQMMGTPLNLQLLLRRADTLYRDAGVVTNTPDGVVRGTLGETIDNASRLAHALSALGIRPGDRVATLMWNTQAHLEAYLGVPCMGAVLHTLNLRLAPPQIAWIANDAGDRLLLADESLLPLVEAIRPHLTTVERVIVVGTNGDYAELLAGAPPEPFPWVESDEDDASAMCYTSGTTGDPKGVVYSHRSTVLHTLSLLFAEGVALTSHDVVLPVVPMFHANAWGMPYAAVACGAGIVMPGPLLQPRPLAELIEAERVTVAAGVPTIWQGLVAELEREPRDLSALRRIPCGGSAIPEALMEAFDRVAPGRMLHAWGMTEVSPVGSCAALPGGSDDWTPEEQLTYRLSQGRASLGVELRLWGFDDREAPWDGETMGEVQVRGPWVAGSYFGGRDPERFEGGWFRTGDVAIGRPDGTFQIVDRTKDVIKSGGEWISSVELENTIVGHPSVREAAVIARPDIRWGERPVACVALSEGASLTLDELRAWLEPQVARFWLPDELVTLDELPKTSVGKLDKKVMRAEYARETATSR